MKSLSPDEAIRALTSILDIPPELSGNQYLIKIAQNICQYFQVEYVLIGHAVAPDFTSIQTNVVLKKGEVLDNFVYELSHTPCENVFTGKRVCIHPNNVSNKFPLDLMLVDMGVESYIGAPTFVGDELIGLLAILDEKPIDANNHNEALIEFLASRVNIELERAMNKEKLKLLEQKSITDPLTGLFNRRYFNEQVEKLMSRVEVGVMVFIDVDNFKKINDNYGHHVGDKALQEIATAINKCLRGVDLSARYGGDEFVVFLSNVNQESALKILERIHDKVNKIFVGEDNLMVSIGAVITRSQDNLEQVITKADKMLYKAKSAGKNQTSF